MKLLITSRHLVGFLILNTGCCIPWFRAINTGCCIPWFGAINTGCCIPWFGGNCTACSRWAKLATIFQKTSLRIMYVWCCFHNYIKACHEPCDITTVRSSCCWNLHLQQIFWLVTLLCLWFLVPSWTVDVGCFLMLLVDAGSHTLIGPIVWKVKVQSRKCWETVGAVKLEKSGFWIAWCHKSWWETVGAVKLEKSGFWIAWCHRSWWAQFHKAV